MSARLTRCEKTRAFIRIATERGWTVSPTKKGHIKFTAPNGAIIVTSSTPSDHRSWKNLRGQLRRNGLPL